MSDGPAITYDRPPIAEVVAAVAFKRIPELDTIQIARFWDRSLAANFPRVEEQPPYSARIERFGLDAHIPSLSIEFDQSFPSPRLWFLSSAGDELLQLQSDWFACNWQKVTPDAKYNRWPARRAEFEKWFTQLLSFSSASKLGDVVPTQCEVTYINHVTPNAAWSTHSELHGVLNLVTGSLNAPLRVEQTALQQSYVIPGDSGEPVGRLHVSARPAVINETQIPIFVLELTARGRPESADLQGILMFLDQARELVVRTFDSITTPEIQREWGRHDNSC